MKDARETEESPRQASQYARSLLEASLVPLVAIGRDGKITDVNEATIKVTGVLREKLIGSDFSDYFTEPEKAREGYQKVFATGQVIDYPLTIRHKDGRLTDVLYNASVYKDERGNVLGVFAAARDVTEIKEIKQAEESLQRLAAITESTDDAIIGKTLKGVITFWNPAAEKIYGYRADEVVGRPIYLLVPFDRLGEYNQIMESIRRGERVQHIETYRRRKDGTRFPVSLTISPILDAEGKILGASSIARDITERKKAEEEKAQAKAYIESSLSSSPIGVLLLDKQVRFTYVNPTFLGWLGRKAEDFIGKTVREISPPFMTSETTGIIAERAARRVETGEPITNADVEFIGRDGKPISISYSAAGIKDEKGNILGEVVFLMDITARKKADEALQKSEGMYKSLIENMSDIVFAIDLVGRVTFSSRSVEKILGYKSEEVINKNIIDFVPPEDRQRAIETIPKGMMGEKITQYQTQAIKKSGDRVFLELAFTRIFKDGAVVGAQAIAKDITESKRVDEALLASQQRFKELTDSIADVFFAMDENLRYTYWNKASEKLTAISSEEAIGRTLYEVFPDVRGSKAEELYLEVLRTRKFKTEINRYNLHGKEHIFELTAYPSGNGLAVLARDITERERTKEQLREKEEQFDQAQKMEAIGRLAGGVAHDFNNILATIIVYSDLLLHDLKEGDPLRGDIEEMRRAADKGVSLTRQLLAVSRRQVLEPKVLNLNNIVYGMEPMLQRLIGEDIELVTALSPDLCNIRADSGQIEQVIMNLVVNSRDAMPGGGRLMIETSNVSLNDSYAGEHMSVTPGAYVMLAVADTGCGMDEDTKSKVFEPFFTTKERGKGTGLGLSTVYGIIKQSGGNISVQSELGKGTTFRIYLPRVDEAVEKVSPVRAAAELPRGSETVLVVEDDDPLRRLILRILKSNGYNVLEARHGNDAIQICEGYKETIDLLLTDVIMPQMSGYELVKRLASMRAELKVLYMSGYTDDTIGHMGILKQDISFIQKPFTSDSLLNKVREVLGSSK